MSKTNFINNLFAILILLLTFVSVNQFSTLPIGPLWFTWLIQISLIVLLFKFRSNIFPNQRNKLLNLYLIWIFISLLRGLFIAENYYEYKQLIMGGISLMCPIFIWLFYKPSLTSKIYKIWFKYALIAFGLFFVWTSGFLQAYLSPLLLLFCFFPLFRKKQAYIILLIGLSYTLVRAEEDRSQFIKGSLALIVGVLSYYVVSMPYKLVKLGHIGCYLCSALLFIFVLTDASGLILGRMTEEDAIENNKNRDVLNKDTRSLIYYDVFNSAMKNDYWLFGHTPARGNEIGVSSLLFMGGYSDNMVFNKGERHKNEILLLNIFTWEGLVGLILYSLLYIRASYLSIYQCRNRYVSLLGCYVAFRWSFGWIEDINNFFISDVALWTMIGICYSSKFRNMTNIEFKEWIRRLI